MLGVRKGRTRAVAPVVYQDEGHRACSRHMASSHTARGNLGSRLHLPAQGVIGQQPHDASKQRKPSTPPGPQLSHAAALAKSLAWGLNRRCTLKLNKAGCPGTDPNPWSVYRDGGMALWHIVACGSDG